MMLASMFSAAHGAAKSVASLLCDAVELSLAPWLRIGLFARAPAVAELLVFLLRSVISESLSLCLLCFAIIESLALTSAAAIGLLVQS